MSRCSSGRASRAERLAGESDAVDHLRRALEQAPNAPFYADAARELATALATRARLHEAVELLESAISQATDRETALLLEAHLFGLGRASDALAARLGSHLDRVSQDMLGRTPGERLTLAASVFHRTFHGLASGEEVAELARRALGQGRLLREATGDQFAFYGPLIALRDSDHHDDLRPVFDEALADARARGSGSSGSAHPRHTCAPRDTRTAAAVDHRRASDRDGAGAGPDCSIPGAPDPIGRRTVYLIGALSTVLLVVAVCLLSSSVDSRAAHSRGHRGPPRPCDADRLQGSFRRALRHPPPLYGLLARLPAGRRVLRRALAGRGGSAGCCMRGSIARSSAAYLDPDPLVPSDADMNACFVVPGEGVRERYKSLPQFVTVAAAGSSSCRA